MPGVPILVMSGHTRDALDGSSEFAAGTAFIEKPFTPEKLISKIREVLDRDRTPPSA